MGQLKSLRKKIPKAVIVEVKDGEKMSIDLCYGVTRISRVQMCFSFFKLSRP